MDHGDGAYAYAGSGAAVGGSGHGGQGGQGGYGDPAGGRGHRAADAARAGRPAGGRRGVRAGRGNARARLTSFVGRERDLETVRGDLARARLVTITGPGGTGKTRLSQEAGDLVADRWPDGVWYAELAPVSDPATVPEAVISSLGLRETLLHSGSAAEAAIAAETKPRDAARQLADYCAGRSLLLVLDNCEHVIDAAASLAEQLLADCPGLAVLATSREPLGVPGELVRPLDPLPDPTALRLLADRGAAARPGFTIEEDPAACAELCRRLDGLPLAIELAAARLRSLSPRQLADRLDDRFRLLTGGSRTLLPRQQTLRAVVDWSWDLMERPERVLLRRLAVFRGGWTLEAAEAVCADPEPGDAHAATGHATAGHPGTGEAATGDAATAHPTAAGSATAAGRSAAGERIAAPDTAALLASLVDKSLVLAEQGEDGVRHRMLETIAEYAAERLTESGERAAVEARHTAYFREYVRTADPRLRGAGQLLWFERLEREHENLRAALRRAVAAGDEQQALQLVLGCSWFWEVRNYVSERRTWPAAVAALGPDPFADPLSDPQPLERGPLDDPPPMEGERLREARRWVRLIDVSAREGDGQWFGDPDLSSLGAELVRAYPPHLPQSARQPGIMRPFGAFFTGDYTRLREMIDETVQACRTHDRPWELAFSLQMRAKINNDVGDLLADSLRDIGESRRLFQRIGDEWGAAETLVAEAEASINGGQWEHAIECCREGIALVRKIGSEQYVPVLTVRMGDATISAGRPEEGERLLREGVAQAERFGAHSDGAAFFGRMLLALHLGRGDRVDEAMEIVEQALSDATAAELSPDGAHGFVAGVIQSLKGYLTGRSGDPQGGLGMIAEGIDVLARHPLAHLINPRLPIMLAPGTVELLTLLAEQAPGEDTARRRARRAATLTGMHDRLRPSVVPPAEAERLEELRARLRALLGEQEYAAAYAEGDGPSVEEAVALMRDVD
ncbi:AAA family ATPase [Actinacidiphila sp. DG2A-62]|uniref:ATP-binding protein n=1 Tax=Actinacidiphila sp. DG2A-62 TaxID=3108821 RepID=UPI002DBF17E9|nr:AAA family ATPase [Actinacidiphila sp. DG2A-62]MEC3993695.1 AAA family ATPase [Actinacidiphila sp. DG2A-62]